MPRSYAEQIVCSTEHPLQGVPSGTPGLAAGRGRSAFGQVGRAVEAIAVALGLNPEGGSRSLRFSTPVLLRAFETRDRYDSGSFEFRVQAWPIDAAV
jgi:hypothetical protein